MGGLDLERKSKASEVVSGTSAQAALNLGSIPPAPWAVLTWRRVMATGKKLQVCCEQEWDGLPRGEDRK